MLSLQLLRGVGQGGWEGGSRGRGYGDICMHMADSLCYTAEANTALWSNYTPIKMYKKNKSHLPPGSKKIKIRK